MAGNRYFAKPSLGLKNALLLVNAKQKTVAGVKSMLRAFFLVYYCFHSETGLL